MRLKYLVLLIIMLTTNITFCQTSQKKIQDTSKTILVVQPQLSNGETQAYKLLYDTSQKSYENQKETEHWFIGIVALFIIFVVGSQVYFNFRFNKQIINDLTSKFDKNLLAAQTELLQKMSEQKTLLTDNLQALFKDANQIAYTAVKKLDEDMSNKVTAAEKYNEMMFENIKADHQKSTSKIQIQFKLTSGFDYLEKKNYLSALLDFLAAGEIALDSDLDVANSVFGVYRSVNGLEDLRLENKTRLMGFLENVNKTKRDGGIKKILGLTEAKIKKLKIWNIDEDGTVRDEKGNIIDIDS